MFILAFYDHAQLVEVRLATRAAAAGKSPPDRHLVDEYSIYVCEIAAAFLQLQTVHEVRLVNLRIALCVYLRCLARVIIATVDSTVQVLTRHFYTSIKQLLL